MIVKAVGDVISLSGSLKENHWLTLKAAANLLLKRNPDGILIDCSGLVHCTPDGAHTFRDAVGYIESHQARMILVNLPPDILTTLQSVPGVRSCLVTARSIEEARASLKLGGATRAPEEKKCPVIMLPLLGAGDAQAIVRNAATVTRARGGTLYLVYVLLVPRALALNAPLAEQEQAATEALDSVTKLAQAEGLAPGRYVGRGRDLAQGLIDAAQQLKADVMLLGLSRETAGEYGDLVEALMKRAPCELIINRPPPPVKSTGAKNGAMRETQQLP